MEEAKDEVAIVVAAAMHTYIKEALTSCDDSLNIYDTRIYIYTLV